jgi:hypothetical protein
MYALMEQKNEEIYPTLQKSLKINNKNRAGQPYNF